MPDDIAYELQIRDLTKQQAITLYSTLIGHAASDMMDTGGGCSFGGTTAGFGDAPIGIGPQRPSAMSLLRQMRDTPYKRMPGHVGHVDDPWRQLELLHNMAEAGMTPEYLRKSTLKEGDHVKVSDDANYRPGQEGKIIELSGENAIVEFEDGSPCKYWRELLTKVTVVA